MYSKQTINRLPQTPGVYLFKDKQSRIIYIGKALNLRQRIRSYQKTNLLTLRTREMINQMQKVSIIRTECEFEALLLEAKLIRKYQPKYNAIAKDDKHPLYIKITDGEFPKIYTSRLESDPDASYFGPFPSSKIVHDTLKFLRRIFPYCTEKRIGKKPCFYAHIGLCNPCPNAIVRLPKKEYVLEKKHYRTNVFRIKHILEGKSKTVINLLTQEMNQHSKELRFEEANTIKQKIDQLRYLTESHINVASYLANPNLYEDQRCEELSSLAKVLGIAKPKRIEGYDISNLYGRQASGSMVVAIGGEIEKKEYRKFTIRRQGKSDDLAMMYEVISRRLKHREWDYPDLILVDGGEQQVYAAKAALKKYRMEIPVVGLAKRLEEIIMPKNNAYISIRIPLHAAALKLLQRIRDEAHRFAKKHHTSLRSKSMLY